MALLILLRRSPGNLTSAAIFLKYIVQFLENITGDYETVHYFVDSL